ncbi:GH92 family glycosyl hydrolase [Polaribacter gangjinensis]|uniref:Alpha-mannosidase n=1 Tax=Polaribacter gangjinensis TaxID=574710 RepID=A0A2S7WE90_9FLAO|nr:GH92 family glycosyl hydrolase [Polaribacter gangjinensis]PQJ75939.1 alpha-mannosidase [Polaribacter gangjinensis]
MKKIVYLVLFLLIINKTSSQEDNTKYIDPTIGNVAQFLVPTYPTFHLPNEMLRMFPIKSDYLKDQVDGFPLQVVTHRIKGLLPFKPVKGNLKSSSWKSSVTIDHDLEIMHPWFYKTFLIDDDISVSFTPNKKSAIYKIDFPNGFEKNLLFTGTSKMTFTSLKNSFTASDTYTRSTRGDYAIDNNITTYFYAEITDQNGLPIKDLTFEFLKSTLKISSKSSASKSMILKYAVSYISFDQAKQNFEKEIKGKTFEVVSKEGKKSWEKVINQIQVEGGTIAQKRTFYTSLYRTYERMININEYGKYYSGYDKKVHNSNRNFYTDDWVWDTYLAQHPLRTILNPTMESDMLNSYTLMFEQSGWMPTFPQIFGNHLCMNAYHSSAIFIDGFRKGIRNYNIESAYKGIKKNLMEGSYIPWRQGNPRSVLEDFYHKNGYFPSLKIGQKETISNVDDFEKRQPVAVSLGINYDFWALSELAKELNKTKDFQEFLPKSKDYKKLWNPNYRLFMPKDEDGNWLSINPKLDGGLGYRDYYDENNGWTYAWSVQHDINGLIDLLGGKKAAENRLDQLFREPLGTQKNLFYVNGSNSTGMVGQFSMGNEPSFHIPFLYNYFGAPWKTQKRTRFLLDVWFKDNIFGIPGDEDGGGMTAFVVFTSMGIYPVTPGLPFYTITSPIFEKTSIKLQNGKTFTVEAKGASKKNKYIQKAFINGKEINSPFISHEQIMNGATLTLKLVELPNKEWGLNVQFPE